MLKAILGGGYLAAGLTSAVMWYISACYHQSTFKPNYMIRNMAWHTAFWPYYWCIGAIAIAKEVWTW